MGAGWHWDGERSLAVVTVVPMYELRVMIEFAASHHLQGYPGDCARPHGHNWTVEVYARSKDLDEIGISVDFRELKRRLKEVVDSWDHQDLNLLEEFKDRNPTAEIIARLIFDRLEKSFDANTTWIDRVTVWENQRCSATFMPDV